MNRLYQSIITGLFVFSSFLGLVGCHTQFREPPFDEKTQEYRRNRPVYDYELEYEQRLRYGRRYRSLPPWTQAHEEALQRRRRASQRRIESEPVYYGVTPSPEESASEDKTSRRASLLSHPEPQKERAENVQQGKEPRSQQQSTFVLVLPPLVEERKAKAQIKQQSKEQKTDEKTEKATRVEAVTPRQEERKKVGDKSLTQNRNQRRHSVPSTSKNKKSDRVTSERSKKAMSTPGTKETKVAQKEEMILQPPTPPDTIDFWLYIRNGVLRANRYLPINYPGKIRAESYRRESGLVVITLVSTFNPKVKWKLVLPREDGEHNVKAVLISK